MSARKRGPRRRTVVLLVLVAVIVIVVAIAVAIERLQPSPGPSPGPSPSTPTPSPTRPKPEAQPASCPDVQMLSVPGTWESSPDDDPHHPSFNPDALLLNVTGPVREAYSDDSGRVDVQTVPYVAQFNRPFAPPEATYDDSRAQGTQQTERMLSQRYDSCPLTSYILIGFSQGAVIAGDVAAEIGAGNGPVPADLVLGVGLVADGRRKAGAPGSAAEQLGVSGGEGAEVMLGGLHDLPGFPGTTMTGARPGGFGALAGRTVEICAPGDLICDAPSDLAHDPLGTIAKLSKAATGPIHAQYAANPILEGGRTATEYLVAWSKGLIDDAPHPAHE